EIGALSESRNRAVHDPRLIDRDTNEVHRLDVTARPKPHFGFKPESIAEQERLHAQIYDLVTRFSKLRDAAITEIEALPPESLSPLRGIIELREASVTPTTE